MFVPVSELLKKIFEFRDPVFQQLFLWLRIFGIFFFLVEELFNLDFKPILYFLDSSFVFGFTLQEQLFIHLDLGT